MEYNDLNLKISKERKDYKDCSELVVNSIENIFNSTINSGKNKVILNTSLKLGLPMENINKLAGPVLEAWAIEVFQHVKNNGEKKFILKNVETGKKLNMADIILKFDFPAGSKYDIQADIDVKSTSKDIPNSGKSPNITSFERIRSAYLNNPDYMFIILSLKHKVSTKKGENTKLVSSIMEVSDFKAYDLKFIQDGDVSYNPALGTGQLQIRDIHNVSKTTRSTWEFCQMLDKKFIASKKGFKEWISLAKKSRWINEE